MKKIVFLLVLVFVFGMFNNSFSYEKSGKKWKISDMPVVYSIDPTGLPIGSEVAIQNAFNTWQQASGSSFKVTYLPSATIPFPILQDGHNFVGLEPTFFISSLAETIVRNVNADNSFVEVDIVINRNSRYCFSADYNYCPPNCYDIQNIVTHCVGQFLGLKAISNNPTATMYHNIGVNADTSKRSLEQDDIDGVIDIYKYIEVPYDYSTIQNALNYATSGQTIVVFPGTHVINTAMTIPAGVTLQIEAGATIIIGSGCRQILSMGKIIASGTANNRIKFITIDPTVMGWAGILLYGSGSNGSVFKYCDIKSSVAGLGGIFMLSFQRSSGSSVSYCDISGNTQIVESGIYAVNSNLQIYKNKLQNNSEAVVGYNCQHIMFGAIDLQVDCNSGNNTITGNYAGITAAYSSLFDLNDIGPEHNHMNNISGNISHDVAAMNNSCIFAQSENYWGGNPPPGFVYDTSHIYWGSIPNCIPGLPFNNIGVIEENNNIAMTPELKKVVSSNAVFSNINEELRKARSLAYSEKFDEAMDIYKSILSNNRDSEYTGQVLNGMLFIYRITQDKELLEYLKVYSRGETDPFAKVAYANALIVSNYVEEALLEYNEIAKNNPKTIHEVVALIQQSYIYYFDKKDVKRANAILAEVEKVAEKDDIHIKQLRSIARGTATGSGNNEYFGNEEEIKETEVKMAGYSLANYPNPFNPTTTIQYSIPKDEFVKLIVYDVTGKVVKELVNGYKTAGKYSVEFNASSYSSGTYYYKIEAGEYKNIQKMMLIK